MRALISRIGAVQLGTLCLALFASVFDMACSGGGMLARLWVGMVDVAVILLVGVWAAPVITGLVSVLRPRKREAIISGFHTLFTANPANSRFANRLLAGAVVTTVLYKAVLLSYNHIIASMRTNTYRGMAIALVAVVMAVVGWLAWLWLTELLDRGTDALSTKTHLIKYIVNTWTVLFILLLALVVAILLTPSLVKALRVIGWCKVITLAALVPALLVILLPRVSSRLQRLAIPLGLWAYYVLSGLSVLFLAFAIPSDASRAAIANGNLSSFCYRILKVTLDFDGDGQISILGDGDCAPFNPHVFTGAPEIPGNGIDENCDGKDLPANQAMGIHRWNFPVPDSFHRRNVVLITVDAWNARRCSFNGYKRLTTPFLNTFIKQCVYFDAAFSQGPSTRLSFPSIFTSRFDPEIKRRGKRRIPFELLPDNRMLAQIMGTLGFHTVAVLPTTYFKRWKGLTAGFEIVDFKAIPYWHRPSYHNGSYVAREAILQMKKAQRPLFMWVHIYDTHGPHVQPPRTRRFGKSEADRYDAEILYVDAQIKKIVHAAQARLGRDTLFIITADHGESFDRRHRRKHHGADIYTPVVHVPLFFCDTDFKPGRREQLASLLDITPTLVNLFSRKPDKSLGFRGNSLVPVLFDPAAHTVDRVFQTMYIPERAVRHKRALWWVGVATESFHMVWDLRHNAIQVFKWRTDIHDRHDLYGRHKSIFRPLTDALNLLIFRIMPAHGRKNTKKAVPAP